MSIRFLQYKVVNDANGESAKVFYSASGGYNGRAPYVVIYSKDYDRSLGRVFADYEGVYSNDSDVMSDYFDKGHVSLNEDHPLYAEALKRAQMNDAKRDARYEVRKAKWAAAVAA